MAEGVVGVLAVLMGPVVATSAAALKVTEAGAQAPVVTTEAEVRA